MVGRSRRPAGDELEAACIADRPEVDGREPRDALEESIQFIEAERHGFPGNHPAVAGTAVTQNRGLQQRGDTFVFDQQADFRIQILGSRIQVVGADIGKPIVADEGLGVDTEEGGGGPPALGCAWYSPASASRCIAERSRAGPRGEV